MAEDKNGVGVSWKFGQAMLWIHRDEWAQLIDDVNTIFGADAVVRLNTELAEAFGGSRPPAAPPNVTVLPHVEQAQAFQDAPTEQTQHERCPVCGSAKDKWVPPGVSKKSGKAYPGFWACPTPGCPGR